MLGIEWLGAESLALGYGDRVAPFQGWRWILGREPKASLRLALGYLIPARWALCEPGPLCSLCSLWLNPAGAGSEAGVIRMSY